MISRRLFLLQLLLILTACKTTETQNVGRLTIGAVSYGEDARLIEQYSSLIDYLQAKLKVIIELEPTFNEIKALEQIKRKVWSLAFAPPGLAAIAISENQYSPLFSLEGVEKTQSLILVRQDSPLKKLTDLSGKVIALGQPGSATDYYLPLYNLYGLTLAEIRLAATPKTILEWITKKEVAAGALSLADLDRYGTDSKKTQFRSLHTVAVPPGSVIVGPSVERNQQEQIRKALASASPSAIAAARYLPNAPAPDYTRLIEIVAKVKPIAEKVTKKPARLFK